MTANDISVIIPTYNRARSLKKAIRSVQSQTQPPREIIVVDDGSTDNTEKICQSLNMTYIKNAHPSGGPAKPRNQGIAAAQGTYIAFLDSDDIWNPKKLETQVTRLNTTHAEFVYSDATVIKDGTPKSTSLLAHTTPCEGVVITPLIAGNFIPTSTVLVKKSRLLEAGGFDEAATLHAFEDYHLWLRLAHAKVSFAYCPEQLINYIEDPHSISRFKTYEGNLRELQMFEALPRFRSPYQLLLLWRQLRLQVIVSQWAPTFHQRLTHIVGIIVTGVNCVFHLPTRLMPEE